MLVATADSIYPLMKGIAPKLGDIESNRFQIYFVICLFYLVEFYAQ
jgi:hypothetical protein